MLSGQAEYTWGFADTREAYISVSSPPPTGVGDRDPPRPPHPEVHSAEKTCCGGPHRARACGRWTTGARLRSWRPTSAPAGRSTESPSSATSSPDTPRGQCQAARGGGGGSGRRPREGPGALGSGGSLGTPGWPSPALPARPSYAYVEFAAEGAAQAAVELDESIFRGRVIKVRPLQPWAPPREPPDPGGARRGHAGKPRHRAAPARPFPNPQVSLGTPGRQGQGGGAPGLDVALGGSLLQLDPWKALA